MTEEIWKDIPGWEGFYRVSDHGNVKSIPRTLETVKVKSGIVMAHFKGRFMAQKKNEHGYMAVYLTKGNKTKGYLVHRLVLMAFVPNPENKPYVDHIDNNPSNNNLSNLRWCTPLENVRHCINQGRQKYFSGLDNVRSKPIAQYDLSGNLICTYESACQAAEKTNFVRTNINKVCRGERRTAHGFKWEFANV